MEICIDKFMEWKGRVPNRLRFCFWILRRRKSPGTYGPPTRQVGVQPGGMNKKGAPGGYERPEMWRLMKVEEESRGGNKRRRKKRLAGGKAWDGGKRTTSFPKSCFHYLRLVGSISPP